ncbi:MAG: Phenylacetic acid catabolic protein [Actinomycetota bacterium]
MTGRVDDGPVGSPSLRAHLLALADDEHLMGQRHAEWVGAGPFLEEDLALAGVGLDELSHAAELYGLLVGRSDEPVDRLAIHRSPEAYRSCWLVEYETAEWARAAVRHWCHDTAEQLRWEQLTACPIPEVAALATQVLSEEVDHRAHIDRVLDVLLDGAESRRRIEFALAELWPLAVGQFDPVVEEPAAVAEGLLPASITSLVPRWLVLAAERFPTVDLGRLEGSCAPGQDARTVRHCDFAVVHRRMRSVVDVDPAARW